MHRLLPGLIVMLMCGVPSMAAPRLKDRIKPIADNILGDWKVETRVTENGETKDGMTDWKIGPGTLSSNVGGVESAWEMKIDPKKAPATLDLTQNGSALHGIVEITGDTMRVCYRFNDGERPTTFEAKDGAYLTILSRPGKR